MKSLLLVLLLGLPVGANAARLLVGDFSSADLSGWTVESFRGETEYRWMAEGGRGFLRAEAEGTASGLVRRLRVDLGRTPWLHWSWRVHRLPSTADERSRHGDDFAARIYLIVDGGWAFWRTRAIDFVWSAGQARGVSWANPYSANVIMIAQRGRYDALGRWFHETVHLPSLLRRHLGREVYHVDAVALMTDTDDTGSRAVADYGDIWFSSAGDEGR